MAKAKNKEFLKKNKKVIIIAAIALLVIIGASYAWLTQQITNSRENVIVAGKLELVIQNEDPILKIGGSYGYGYPMTDADGHNTTPYTFTVRNTGTESAAYALYLEDVNSYTDKDNNTVNITSSTRISDDKLKYQLRNTSGILGEALLSTMSNPRKLYRATLAAGESITYYLRVWIDGSATNNDVTGKAFAAKIRIEATQNIDEAKADFVYY